MDHQGFVPVSILCKFDLVWTNLANAGVCDEVGGAEYLRVLGQWTTHLASLDPAIFIRNHANQHPTQARGMYDPES
jgi:hypothetical protein